MTLLHSLLLVGVYLLDFLRQHPECIAVHCPGPSMGLLWLWGYEWGFCGPGISLFILPLYVVAVHDELGLELLCTVILWLWYKAVGLNTGQSHYAIQWLLWLIFTEDMCCRSRDYCSDADFCYHRVAPKPQHIAEVGIIVCTVRNLSLLDRPVELRYGNLHFEFWSLYPLLSQVKLVRILFPASVVNFSSETS